jgi:rhodanese-related sulfurtransferase
MEFKFDREKKEHIAIIIGLFLILFVVAVTLFRSKLFSGQNGLQNGSQTNQVSNILGYQTISARDLHKKIILADKKNNNITLLDVRPFESYAQEHIVDSVNITPDEFPLDQKINKNNLIFVIGANSSDENIKKTVKELKKESFGNFYVLAGGMEVWKSSVGATVTYGDPNSFLDQSKVSYVEMDKLKEALKQNIPMFIVDIRSGDDFAKGHIAGAINIPAEDLEKRRSEITQNKVVVVGLNELQEFQSSVQMYDMLLVSPFILKGGMTQWIDKGYPIVK